MDFIQAAEPIKVSGSVVASYGSEYTGWHSQGRAVAAAATAAHMFSRGSVLLFSSMAVEAALRQRPGLQGQMPYACSFHKPLIEKQLQQQQQR